MKKILAVILCGGESKRMGTDKGLMPIHDTVRAKFMAQKVSFLDIPVVYSINKDQLENYAVHIDRDRLVVDANKLAGPARGLLTIHQYFAQMDILLLACDMLELDEATIKKLFEVYEQEKNYDYYVYQDDSYAQPFCGIYTSKAVATLNEEVIDRSITNLSMQSVLDKGNTKRLKIENRNAFANANFPGA